MGTAAKKKRPMRSRRSGVKKLELVKANLAVLQKLAALFIIILFAACTPVRYVYIDPKDSVVREQRTIRTDVYLHSPFYYRYYTPFYIPAPRVVVPQRPTYRHVQPLQRPTTPWRVPRRN